jgi:para-nitrobenzyl esterase
LPLTRHLPRRLLLQSGGNNAITVTRAQATAVAAEVMELLGVERSDPSALRTLPVDALLDAQVQLIARRGGGVVLPFNVVADDAVPSGGTIAFLRARADAGLAPLDAMVGTTRDELLGFFRLNQQTADLDDAAALGLLRATFGDAASRLYEHYTAVRPAASATEKAAAITADRGLLAQALRFADERSAHGETTYVYRFDWAGSRFGACHCIDLPFTFAELDAWGADAAMVGDASDPAQRAAMADLAGEFSGAIGSFVRTGARDVASSRWPRYDSAERAVAQFGAGPFVVTPGLGQPERELFDELAPLGPR